jgi:fumarate hydratase, class II
VGNDVVVTLGNQSGNFELNTMMPVMTLNLLNSISLLAAVSGNFARQCVAGLQATDQGPEMVERGLMLTTALAPAIGYDAAAEIAKEAAKTGKTVREVALARGVLSAEQLAELLDPEPMTEPGVRGIPGGGV